jgi:hypothetical protein
MKVFGLSKKDQGYGQIHEIALNLPAEDRGVSRANDMISIMGPRT